MVASCLKPYSIKENSLAKEDTFRTNRDIKVVSLARVSATTRTLSSAAQPQKVRFLREAEVRRDAKPANSVENDPKRTLDAVLHPFVDLRECEIGHVGWAPHHRQDLGRDIEPRAGSGRRRMALRVARGTLSFRSRNAARSRTYCLFEKTSKSDCFGYGNESVGSGLPGGAAAAVAAGGGVLLGGWTSGGE